jgi:hypothetical protein
MTFPAVAVSIAVPIGTVPIEHDASSCRVAAVLAMQPTPANIVASNTGLIVLPIFFFFMDDVQLFHLALQL